MRTNIDLDDDLLKEARRYSSASTKRALVEEALRTFVEVKSNERQTQDYARRSAEIRELTSKIRMRKSSHDIIREDRDHR